MAIKKQKAKLIEGTMFSFDTNDLAMIGKTERGISLNYKQGGSFEINVKLQSDRDRQYRELLSAWRK